MLLPRTLPAQVVIHRSYLGLDERFRGRVARAPSRVGDIVSWEQRADLVTPLCRIRTHQKIYSDRGLREQRGEVQKSRRRPSETQESRRPMFRRELEELSLSK